MNEYEEMFLKWLDEQKAKEGLVSVNHSTTDGDTSSEEFFAEANAMNAAEATVSDGKENFPRYELLVPLVEIAMDKAIAAGRAKPFKFNDKTTKK